MQTPDIEENLDATLDRMRQRGVLEPLAGTSDLTIARGGRDTFLFLCMLLWPFVDTFWVTCTTLLSMQPDRIMWAPRPEAACAGAAAGLTQRPQGRDHTVPLGEPARRGALLQRPH